MDDPYRLPHTALPSRYELHITPDLAAATFTGTVVIHLDLMGTTRSLVCNAIELEVFSASMDGVPVESIALDPATERVTFTLADAAAPGPHQLVVAFSGILNDKLRGFYRSTWTDDSGREHVLGTTQMQSTDARRAFPCWDEPEFKAVFAISLTIDEGLEAISNSPEVSRIASGDGKVTIAFGDTMAMSTYLVAWVVGELEMSDTVDVGGIPLRLVHVPGKGHLTAFGLDCAAAGLRWFQEYYAIPYPGEKVDLVALPDFAAGAMENLGCITFRESLLLVDPEVATHTDLELVADVVLHELAHMWFGDLVTMRWWNGIWLNEAFATFMEIAAVDAYKPDWKRWDLFNLERGLAFEVDALAATRPVEFDVVSPDDASGMFDVLTYQKGGALLRMAEQYLQPERFRAGVNRYLRDHAYGSTETSDLWDALEAETGEPVRRVMDSWIWQGGHPLVSAHLDGQQLLLEQRRFRYDGADDASTWAVPLIVRNGNEELRHLLDGPTKLTLPNPTAPVIVNAGGYGFYRVHYSEDLLNRLEGPALRSLTPAERYGLVDDAWNGVIAGDREADWFCSFVRRFVDDADLALWRLLSTAFATLDRSVDDGQRPALASYVRAMVAPVLGRVGRTPSESDDDVTSELRGVLLRTAAVLGDDQMAIDICRDAIGDLLADRSINAALGAAAVSVMANLGDADLHRRYVQRFNDARTPQEMLRFLYALAEFPGRSELEGTIALALSPKVKSQNAPYLIGRCMSNRRWGQLAWDAMAANWGTLVERFPGPSIPRMIEGVRALTEPAQVAAVQAFFAEHPVPQAQNTVGQHLERQAINAQLRLRVMRSLTSLTS
ncbi:MAG: M1 family metallopeptidase [Acidimicrobiia bacterium]